ncbi:MAG: hypothetical protein H0X70_10705 [Segetibacter sp.]|nr:hypothetical protein [Segetibacter sp.]
MVQAEVSRGRSTVGYEPHKAWRPHKRPEGLNVRMAKQSGRLWQKRLQPKPISELPVRG